MSGPYKGRRYCAAGEHFTDLRYCHGGKMTRLWPRQKAKPKESEKC